MKQGSKIKTRRLSMLGNSSGQAVVEYILMVAVSISILFALKGAFSSAGEFVDKYVGAYTVCLMEYGELPSLGLSEPDLTQHKSDGGSVCNPKFGQFTFAEGRPPLSGAGGSTTGSRNNQGSQKSTEGSGKNDSNASNLSNRKSTSDSDVATSGLGGPGRSSPYTTGSLRRGGSGGVGDGAGSASKVTNIDDPGEVERADRRSPGRETRTIYRTRDRYKALTGQMAEDFEKRSAKVTKREPGRQTIAKNTEEGFRPGPRTNILPVIERKVASVAEGNESGWGLGNLIKWILIIGIIVAIVVFFGGQILNYSNSDS